jgi:DNA-binding Xre family transcriptional regulator
MAKLKQYEIEAILNTIKNKYREKRKAKVQKVMNELVLTEQEETMIKKIEEFKTLNDLTIKLEKEIGDIYQIMHPKAYRWGWKGMTLEDFKTEIADRQIEDNFNIDDIRNELIINNIEGNDVANFIDEVLNRFNFDD